MTDDNDRVITELAKMMNHVDQRFDQITSHVDERYDDTMTKMDAVYKEVIAIRQEQSAHQAQHSDIENRLESIEQVSVVAHELKLKN